MLGDILHNLKFDLGHILKSNSGKFQFVIVKTNTDIKVKLFPDGSKIEKFQEVVLLGITINDKLGYKTRIENIYRKAKYKFRALQRIRKYLSTDKAKAL